MHDFIQLQSFGPARDHHAAAARHSVPEWVQHGLMRSFGEDNFVAAYRPSPKSADHAARRAKSSPRSAILPSNQ